MHSIKRAGALAMMRQWLGTTWSGKDWRPLAVRENVQRRPARSTPAERVVWAAASRNQ